MSNSIFAIRPYKWYGLWVFDDPARNMVREPFVGGADALIDRATSDVPDAASGFVAVFSAAPFPGSQIMLTRLRPESGGTAVRCIGGKSATWTGVCARRC